jgi:GH15 family glucan-1,4-alpha-glucosidase
VPLLRENTTEYWRDWVRGLSIPFQWQEEIIRAAITLHLAVYQDTGAIVAAVTTSLPEAPTGGRTWDYRFCWLRDSFFVVNALNRLNNTRTMERYIDYIINIATATRPSTLQPMYRLNGVPECKETIVETLPGYRGLGPVRIGNQAYEQIQHDVYGSAVLARRTCSSTGAWSGGERGALPRARAPGERRAASGTSPTRASGSCAARSACTRTRR